MTLAHEYNHILQFGYDAFQDAWFAESTATWMEDQVYNDIDDYLRYVRRWVKRWDTPLTTSSIKEYGSAVWNEWLAHRYGAAIVRQAWARAIHVRPGGFSVDAYESAIRAAGALRPSATTSPASPPPSPSGAPARASARAALYPDMPRQGSLPLDGRAADPAAEPHHLRSCCGCARRGGPRRRRRGRRRRAGPPPAWPWSAASAASASGRTVTRLDYSRGGGKLDGAPRATPAASAASPPWSSTPTPAPTASAPAASTGAT